MSNNNLMKMSDLRRCIRQLFYMYTTITDNTDTEWDVIFTQDNSNDINERFHYPQFVFEDLDDENIFVFLLNRTLSRFQRAK